MQRPLLILCALGLLAGCGRGIPVVGLDENGNTVDQKVPGKIFSNKLGKTLELVEHAALPALEERQSQTPWKLRAVVVAIGPDAERTLGQLIASEGGVR